jgi:hypothetical protein
VTTVFRDSAPGSESGRNRLTLQRCLLPPLSGQRAAGTSEMSGDFYRTTRFNVPEDCHLQTRHFQNAKSHLRLIYVISCVNKNCSQNKTKRRYFCSWLRRRVVWLVNSSSASGMRTSNLKIKSPQWLLGLVINVWKKKQTYTTKFNVHVSLF